MEIRHRKLLLLAVIGLTFVIPILSFSWSFVITTSFTGLARAFAQMAGLLSAVMLTWMILLGARGLLPKFVVDLIFVNKIHKWLGIYGLLLILLHPMMIFLSYGNNALARLVPNLQEEYSRHVFLGQFTLILILANWLLSHLMRKNISYRWWKRFHFINYLFPGIIFIHSFYLGTNVNSSPILYVYWQVLAIVYVLAIIYRLLYQVGMFKYRSKITKVEQITHDVIRVTFTAPETITNSTRGQFIYVQISAFGESHPYTIAFADPVAGTASVSTKILGKFGKNLQAAKEGDDIYLDGPFGVFTAEMTDLSADAQPIFIAGGIGITPFLRHWQESVRPLILFHGNKTSADMVYHDWLRQFSQHKVVDVLSNEDSFTGEKGYITFNTISKYVVGDLSKAVFFICGPAPMMASVKKDLVTNGISSEKIFTEEFAL